MFAKVNCCAPATIVCAAGCEETLIASDAVFTVIVLSATDDVVIDDVEIVLPVTCPVTVVQAVEGTNVTATVPFEPKPEPTLPLSV